MYNSKYVIAGIILFVAIFTSPFWLNIFSAKYDYPELAKPVGKNGKLLNVSSRKNGCAPTICHFSSNGVIKPFVKKNVSMFPAQVKNGKQACRKLVWLAILITIIFAKSVTTKTLLSLIVGIVTFSLRGINNEC